MSMFGLGFGELVVILILALILFGPGKLPKVGYALGASIREFKRATHEIASDLENPPTKSLPPGDEKAS